MYIEKIKNRMLGANHGEFWHSPRMVGCTPEEINELEVALGVKLPLAYREFLEWTGKGGWFFSGWGAYYYDLIGIQSYLSPDENDGETRFPDDAFVILTDW